MKKSDLENKIKKAQRKIKKMQKESAWQDYGWMDVEEDLVELLEILEK